MLCKSPLFINKAYEKIEAGIKLPLSQGYPSMEE